MSLDNDISKIRELLEDIPPPGSTTMPGGACGGSMANIAMMAPPSITTVSGYGNSSEPEEPQYSELELKIANRFIELVGGAERARELISKCDECNECLGLVDDESDSIEGVAAMMPVSADLPTGRGMEMSALYNPSATVGPFV